jgi:hypothetical protein
MAGIDPEIDPRGALWEKRLRRPVMAAALLALPTVFLYFSKLEGWVAILAVTLAWSIWIVFVVEAVIMLTVVEDRWAWTRGHLFGLAIIIATFPALTSILEGLLAARALSSLQATRVLQVLYLAKAGKLIKSALLLHKDGSVMRHPVISSAVVLALAIMLVGIGHRVVSGEKHATPVHNAIDLVDGDGG